MISNFHSPMTALFLHIPYKIMVNRKVMKGYLPLEVVGIDASPAHQQWRS